MLLYSFLVFIFVYVPSQVPFGFRDLLVSEYPAEEISQPYLAYGILLRNIPNK